MAAKARDTEISVGELNRRKRAGELIAERNHKHGMAGTPTYRSWQAMRDRCLRPTHRKFENYGGRGIAICARWDDFTLFLADMGIRPAGTTLDRIDSNGDYEKSNCRWSTWTVQGRNKRSTKLSLQIAREIRARQKAGESHSDIATAYKVSTWTVQSICIGRSWKEEL